MAEVYRAYDPRSGQCLALKILKAGHSARAKHAERFLREAKTTATLHHPKIVTIYDIGSFEELPYIAMELLTGGSLAEKMHGGIPMSTAAILTITTQIASALEHAHGHRVIHLDLKPTNILFAEGACAVKITDFGIALSDKGIDKKPGQGGILMATPRYMSPEQATGTEPDARSDLFSLGLVLYEMITGQKVFEADTLTALIAQIAGEEPAPITDLVPDVPPGLQKIVAKMLQKKPARRFQSAGELALALAK